MRGRARGGLGPGQGGARQAGGGAEGGPVLCGAGQAGHDLDTHHPGHGQQESRQEGPGHDLRPGVPLVGGAAERLRRQVADGCIPSGRHPGRGEQGDAGHAGEEDQDHSGKQRGKVPVRGEVREEPAQPPHQAVRQGPLHDDPGHQDGPAEQLRVQAAHGPVRAADVPPVRGVVAREDPEVLLRRHQQRDFELRPHHGAHPVRRNRREEGRAPALRHRGSLRQVQRLPAPRLRQGVLPAPHAHDGPDRGGAQVRAFRQRGGHSGQPHQAAGGAREPDGLRIQPDGRIRRAPGVLQEKAGHRGEVLWRDRQGRVPELRKGEVVP
mmetsp:Transcript_12955/g.40421  ORF Transcript_12955/g.40421 Transcript_12955/m.40421 type:complete len:323 (+) Transcript_12955:522-1490(+)